MERRNGGRLLVTTTTVTCLIKVLGEEGLVHEALAAFYRMKQLHCRPDFRKARFLLEQMELPGARCPPDTFTYTILLKAIRRRLWEANHMFRHMIFKGFTPDVVTYNCLIDGCCKTYRIERALELFDDMLKKCCVPNRITYNSFIRYYSAVNEIDKAVEMMCKMNSYTPIIHAVCEGGRVLEARDFLMELVDGGSFPREYTAKLVRDALKSTGGETVIEDELWTRIEEGIKIRPCGRRGSHIPSARNRCPFPLWPATASNAGNPVIADGGFFLPSGQTKHIQAPPTWIGRMWARTGCDFTSTSNTKRFCQTGDCGGKIACNGNIGLPPATLVQVSLQPDTSKPSFYDVSLASNCYIGGCLKDLNKICPQELQVLNGDGEVVACKSACLAFNHDMFCCRNAYGNPNKCKPNMYSNMFKEVCPSYYTYPFDSPPPLVSCTTDEYAAPTNGVLNTFQFRYRRTGFHTRPALSFKRFIQVELLYLYHVFYFMF
ncbi:hypothetical protein MKX01_032326 [Papaver californicum]|nr:hypothetical protein MKX01_032326 [Papaver californicum]